MQQAIQTPISNMASQIYSKKHYPPLPTQTSSSSNSNAYFYQTQTSTQESSQIPPGQKYNTATKRKRKLNQACNYNEDDPLGLFNSQQEFPEHSTQSIPPEPPNLENEYTQSTCIQRTSKSQQLPQIDCSRTTETNSCLLYTSPSPRDKRQSRMPSSA